MSRSHTWAAPLRAPLVALAALACLLAGCAASAASAPTADVAATAPMTEGVAPATIQDAYAGKTWSDFYGFDVRNLFVDHEATKTLGDPAWKIVTCWIAIGNRRDFPLAFGFADLRLWDMYDHRAEPKNPEKYIHTETVPPIWSPALEQGEIPAHSVVGGYVSWKVPWYVWPSMVDYRFPTAVAGTTGMGRGWATPICKDLNGGSPLYLPVGKLLYRGVAETFPDGTFRAYTAITAVQLAKMLVLANAPYNQADLPDAEAFLAEAETAGLATWGSKKAADALTRLEVAKAVARLDKDGLASPPAGYRPAFTDLSVSDANDLAVLVFNGIIGGTSATAFSPNEPCTRGQACRMLALLLDSGFRGQQSRVVTR